MKGEQNHDGRSWGGLGLHYSGRVGRVGRTAANVCSRRVRGRLRYPETVPSWPETSPRAVRMTAEEKFPRQNEREMEAVRVAKHEKLQSRGEK